MTCPIWLLSYNCTLTTPLLYCTPAQHPPYNYNVRRPGRRPDRDHPWSAIINYHYHHVTITTSSSSSTTTTTTQCVQKEDDSLRYTSGIRFLGCCRGGGSVDGVSCWRLGTVMACRTWNRHSLPSTKSYNNQPFGNDHKQELEDGRKREKVERRRDPPLGWLY